MLIQTKFDIKVAERRYWLWFKVTLLLSLVAMPAWFSMGSIGVIRTVMHWGWVPKNIPNYIITGLSGVVFTFLCLPYALLGVVFILWWNQIDHARMRVE